MRSITFRSASFLPRIERFALAFSSGVIVAHLPFAASRSAFSCPVSAAVIGFTIIWLQGSIMSAAHAGTEPRANAAAEIATIDFIMIDSPGSEARGRKLDVFQA